MADEPELHEVPLETPEKETADMPVVQAHSDSTAGFSTNAVNSNANDSAESKNNQKDSSRSNQLKSTVAKTNSLGPAIADRVLNHNGDGLKQLTYLELLMADERGNCYRQRCCRLGFECGEPSLIILFSN